MNMRIDVRQEIRNLPRHMQLDDFVPAKSTECPYLACVRTYEEASHDIEKLGPEDPMRHNIARLMREAFTLYAERRSDGFAQQSLRNIAAEIAQATQQLLRSDDGRKRKKQARQLSAA